MNELIHESLGSIVDKVAIVSNKPSAYLLLMFVNNAVRKLQKDRLMNDGWMVPEMFSYFHPNNSVEGYIRL